MRKFNKWMLAGLAALGLAAAGGPAAQASEFTGTCLASPSLPCSAAAGQTYTNLTLGIDTPGGNDSEAAVEAVLAHVLGPPVDVTPLATDLTAGTHLGDFNLTPDLPAGGLGLDWSYRGPAQNLAYLTVKAGNGFAVFGVAGKTSGTVNLADLTGGHGVSHVGFWTTSISKAAPVAAKRLHGEGFFGNSRLGKIENGKVPCLHVETAERAQCAFNKRARNTGLLGGLVCPLLDILGLAQCPPAKSGSWLESPGGDYALTGQSVSLQGEPGGPYVIAAKLNPNGTVPALEPAGHDTAGTVYGQELARSCMVETMNTAADAMDAKSPGYRIINYASSEVGTTTNPHPDGARLTRSTPDGVFYYRGDGAALNDNSGTERNKDGVYYTTTDRCHVVISNGADVPGAKRPSVYYPAGSSTLQVNVRSSIRWRPVASSVSIAN